jgi:GTP diphosphokinase / guanosine-3',5'-bis(diphosphate) 3'-diphosphatase
MDFLTLGNEYKEHDIAKFKLAIVKAEILKSQKRKAGDTYFDHNLRVAEILVDNKSSPEVIITALLQRCNLPDDVTKSLFGEEVLKLMHGANILRELTFKNKQLHADAFKKMILTTLDDVRVILVKLADKIDNLKSLSVFPESEQIRMAQEVLAIYAPLAYRLGVDRMKSELEDLAFKILNPRKYHEIVNFLEESSNQREKNVKEVISRIKEISVGKVQIIKIKGRPKHIYSIYKKITKRGVKLNQQYDLLGIRVIVQDVKDCYIILGLLHENFEPVDGRLKDYIANPKPNSYQSIHTAIKLPSNKIIEIQVRTPEMDELAEEGIAAHWRYKGMKAESSFEKKMSWLRNVLDLQKESKDFLETLKVDVFGDKIYCYTPKGDVKELPLGACVLDFAYLVHEHVGNTSVAGRVNGKFVPLKHKLLLGDVVEIVTNKNQRPRRGWIKLVKSPRARQKIRKSLKEYEHLPAFHYHKIKPLLKDEQGILVESEEFSNATCVLAKCCLAIPGEEIVGLLTKRRIISVHRSDCRAALKEQERWIPVKWKETFNQKIAFYIRASERSGLLADLLHTIASAGFEVKEAKAKMLGSDMAECSFSIIPRDLNHLKKLIERVNKVKGVRLIYFD